MAKIDEGHASLNALARTYGQLRLEDASEAETRFHVIDELLTRVLGWEREDITVEERVSADGTSRFADYILRTPAASLVVEAKRAGAAFTLPTKLKLLKLGGVLSEGGLGDAIRHARDY